MPLRSGPIGSLLVSIALKFLLELIAVAAVYSFILFRVSKEPQKARFSVVAKDPQKNFDKLLLFPFRGCSTSKEFSQAVRASLL